MRGSLKVDAVETNDPGLDPFPRLKPFAVEYYCAVDLGSVQIPPGNRQLLLFDRLFDKQSQLPAAKTRKESPG